MSADRPAPLVSAEVDLRGLEYMPLFGGHLFASDFHARANDAEWRAGVTLWLAAWGQVPAGSLPTDDVVLCRLAELGRNLREWRRVKARALHGFVECSDGRMYHRFLCEQALVAWEKRVKDRIRKAKWRQGRDADGDGDNGGVSASHGQGRDADVPPDVTVRDGTVREGSEAIASGAAAPAPLPSGESQDLPGIPAAAPTPPNVQDLVWATGVALLTAADVSEKNARSFLAAQLKVHRPEAVLDALQRCAAEGAVQPVPWLVKTLESSRGRHTSATLKDRSGYRESKGAIRVE